MDTLGKKNVTEMIGELDKNGVDAEAMDMLTLRSILFAVREGVF